MLDDNLFFKNLLEKNMDLVETVIKEKYTFVIPSAKYITPNMLIRSFYDNHTFYQCKYDPKMYINLNGKVLECKNNQFQTFLGFRREMVFNVIEELMREVGIVHLKVIYIDNVIDESVYNDNSNQTQTQSKKETIKRYNNKEDYVKYFNNLTKVNDELKEVEMALRELENRLQNNYILIKGHVHTYYKYFQELVNEFRSLLSSKMNRYKLDDSMNVIVHELCESLVFSKIYQFLYINLKQFNSDDEADLKIKMNNLKNDFSFTIYKLDSVFNSCNFKLAITEIKRISNFSSPFEKMAVLNQVNTLIDKEARECLEKNSFKKKSFQLTADELLPMWIYVIINADIPNILTERVILQDFSLKSGLNENDFILILFIQAIESFKKENNTPSKYTNISPIYIQTKTIIPETQSDTNYSSRSQSMATSYTKNSQQSSRDRDDSGLFGSVTNTFKGMFKKEA